jgi:release factor glutamine methyltransferase
VAYLTGRREFWSLQLSVNPAVLVPRPETELLVELALERLPVDSRRAVLDLGTGSGAIALALAHERPRAALTGTDLSGAALAVARANARALGLERIEWLAGGWFGAVPGRRFDLIVSNPPYVAAGDPALAELAAEPALALTPGPGGLEALGAIAAGAAGFLNPGGCLLLEHGATQAAAVAALLARHGFGGIATRPDAAGLPRVTHGTFHPST